MTTTAGDAAEDELLLRVLSALLREDTAGLRTRTTPLRRSDGLWLRLPLPAGGALLLPVADDGFQCEYAARLPLLEREPDGAVLTGLDRVIGALTELADPEDRGGYAAFAAECRQTLTTMRLHAESAAPVRDRLAAAHGDDPADWTGWARSLAFDTLAAYHDHPVYPTARGRLALGQDQLRRYAPEFHPSFELRWAAVPLDDLTPRNQDLRPGSAPGGEPRRAAVPVDPQEREGCPGDALGSAAVGDVAPGGSPCPGDGRAPVPDGPVPDDPALGRRRRASGAAPGSAEGAPQFALPDWWPTPGDLGLPHLDGSHLALPVHPLTFPYLPERAVPAEPSRLTVVPTLSMRTVALADDPSLHLKLPLPTATLGLRNRRTIKPGTLEDGATTERLLRTVLDREPRFRGRILHADEQQHLHAGHELLAVLLRRYPPGLDDAVIVPLAALLAEGPGGRRVIDRLAERFYGGDVPALLHSCLTLLLDWQTTLFTYGIALESHQQNTSLVLDLVAGRPRARLLFKDNDGPRVNPHRLKEAIGQVPYFADPRTFTDDDGPLADLFTTITVHLCAAAFAFGLPEHRDQLLDLIRDRLGSMADASLRAQVLDAAHLPVKAMVTAGTLLTKERSGAADINKHYTTGPNYLRRAHGKRA